MGMKKFQTFFLCSTFLLALSCGVDEYTEIENGLNAPGASDDSTSNSEIAINDGPSGWILAERFASDDNQYTFCPDGTILFDNNFGTELDGTWQLENDTLTLIYTRRIAQVGIGEPLPPPPAMPGNYVDQYEEYEEVIEKMYEEQILIWSEIKTFLDQDSTYPYEILKRGFVCD
jgi:hypothetical protein